MSSLALDVSIPAVVVIVCVIFVDPTKLFRQPSGSDEGAGAIMLRGSHKLLRADSIRSPAALPRIAVRGRAFLSEQAHDNRIRYYKGGLAKRNPPSVRVSGTRGLLGRTVYSASC